METTTDLLKKLNIPSALEGSKGTLSGTKPGGAQQQVKVQNYEMIASNYELVNTPIAELKGIANRTQDTFTFNTVDSMRQTSISQALMNGLKLNSSLRKE